MRPVHHKRKREISAQCDEISELIAQNKHQFKRIPLGPLSSLIRAREEKYADAIELAIRASLQRFIVDNQEDNLTLCHLCMHNELPIPLITVQAFDDSRCDTKHNEPPSDQLTILRVVTSKHQVVLNYLIDRFSIESTLVCETWDEAVEKLFRHRIANAKNAYTLTGQHLRLINGTTETNTNSYKAKIIKVALAVKL
jgi:chromosome segregation ATPase